jgi:hypothetical protein
MSFQLPGIGSQPIIGGSGHVVGQISSSGRIDIGGSSAQIGLDGRVFQVDRQVGEIGLTGLRLNEIGPYRSIQNGIGDEFRIR